MKKTFLFFLALVASVGTMKAELLENVEIDGLKYNLDTELLKAEVARNWYRDGDLFIPPTVDYNEQTYTVRSISASAFWFNDGLTGVDIPYTVQVLGDQAFGACENLAWVNISNSISHIGESAFSGSKALTYVVIPNNVRTIGDYAFSACPALETVVLGNNVQTIGEGAFNYCTALTNINIPSNVFEVGENAFQGCFALTEPLYNSYIFVRLPDKYEHDYTIPFGIQKIANTAFAYCFSLTWVEIPTTVKIIGNNAFSSCSSLGAPIYTSTLFAFIPQAYAGVYEVPEGIQHITGGACSYRSLVTEVVLPQSLLSIGDKGFAHSNITTMTIPENVTNLGIEAFAGCLQLKDLTCEAVTPPTCAADVFNYVDKSIPLYVPEESIEAYQNDEQWGQFTDIQSLSNKPTGIDEITNDKPQMTNKFFRNGQLLILRDGKTYTPTGQEVK